jgi:hypothetical protein
MAEKRLPQGWQAGWHCPSHFFGLILPVGFAITRMLSDGERCSHVPLIIMNTYSLLQLSLDQSIDRHAFEDASAVVPSLARVDCAMLHRHLYGSSSSTHDGTMAEFECEKVQIAVSAGLVGHPCDEVVESLDKT